MNVKKFLLRSLFFFAINLASAATITNTSPFYLHLQSGDAATCQSTIAPGAQGTINGYCGYDACSTNDFNSSGCQEVSNGNTGNTSLTAGGYATYLGLSSYSSQNSVTCSIGWQFIPYQCNVDASGNFSLAYKSTTQIFTPSGAPVTIPAVQHYTSGPLFRGINISGLEYDGTMLDALFQHPDVPDARYFAAQGMNLVRLPIRAEYVFGAQADPITSIDPNPNDPGIGPNNTYLSAVYDTVQKYLANGLSVDLDLHNYMRFCPTGAVQGQGNEPTDPVNNNCSVLSAEQLSAIWATIMTTPLTVSGIQGTVTFADLASKYPATGPEYKGPQLMFGIMNEPFSQDNQVVRTQTIFNNEVAAAKAIQALAPNNLILFSGNGWDPLHEWLSPTTQDSTIFTAANLKNAGVNPINTVVEVHQYFDDNYSGTHEACNHYASKTAFLQDMGVVDSSGNDIFSTWMQQNSMKVMLTEFGGADNADCQQDMKWMLDYMNTNAYDLNTPQNGGFIGWAAWRANRNGGGAGFAPFNFLQQKDQTVYGAPTPGATGILQGQGNGLMTDVFAAYLSTP